jgi:uncharacterized repeat protein (TIGR01451 family)
MKKFLPLLISFILFAGLAEAQYVTIPDPTFRGYLQQQYPSCFNSSGMMDTTCSAILSEDTLLITNLGIKDLTGIQYFKSLKYLDCSHNIIQINPFDPLAPTITLPNSLIYLNCSYAFQPDNNDPPFTYLPTLPGNLTYLDCSYDGTLANFSLPNSLTYLNCSQDGLYVLPALPNTLTYLDCSTQIDRQLQPDPLVLDSLPSKLPDSLKTLICYYNAISVMPPLPKSLVSLDCHFMYSGSTSDAGHLYPTFSCLPILPATLIHLSCDSRITCLPNLIPGLYTDTYDYNVWFNPFVSYNPNDTLILPVCNPTNDVNHCQGFPVISGNIFYDDNSNGIKDSNEFYAPNVSLQLSDSKHSFTNGNGYYEISPDSIGNYKLTINTASYYRAIPDSISYNFGRYDTTVSQNIALQPTANVDSFKINLIPLVSTARPGLDFPYLITYSNVGTTTLSPNITFNYSNILLDYDSSTNASAINNGTNLSLTGTNLAPGQSGSFITDFTLKSTDVSGEVLFTNANIKVNSSFAADSNVSIIRGSYDPNDKEATPQLTPHEVAIGKSINYIVHFQNTGNAFASNIVIADTLSSLLDANSVQVNASSNPCKVTVNGNVVFFEFLNINLPDSNTNQSGSLGFVSFSVKPQSTVNSGSIDNTASVYFDYNTPVVTNTATTLIQDSNSTVPLQLLSFTLLTQPNNTNALLYWNTANEINTKSFVIEESNDDINFTALATVPAKGYNGNAYTYGVTINTSTTYYRLKMIDNNGQYTYSTVIKINGLQDTESFIVLINPAKNKISIKTSAPSLTNTIAKIINSEGLVVCSFALQQGIQTIDVSKLSAGFYYIKTDLVTRKIVIVR